MGPVIIWWGGTGVGPPCSHSGSPAPGSLEVIRLWLLECVSSYCYILSSTHLGLGELRVALFSRYALEMVVVWNVIADVKFWEGVWFGYGLGKDKHRNGHKSLHVSNQMCLVFNEMFQKHLINVHNTVRYIMLTIQNYSWFTRIVYLFICILFSFNCNLRMAANSQIWSSV